MTEFLLSDFINLTEDNKSFIRKNCNMIVYRFYFEDEDLSYVGVTRSLINRLYNWMYGHITLMNNRKVDKELYNLMRSSDPNKVHFYVEKKCTDLVDLSDSEIETISKYDSYNNGLNRTRGGFIKCIWVTNGTSRIRVPRLRVPDGYYPVDKDEARITKKSINNRVSSNKSGKKKKSYVRTYVKRTVVNNGKSIKRVKESQIDEFLREGYVLGGSSVMATLKGKVFVYKTSSEDRILIEESELDKYLSMGYKKGRCSRENPLKGSIRITNGVINLVLYNQDDDIPEGFYKGVTNWNTKGNTGRTFINDGVRDKAVLVEEAEKYISTGKYKYGRLASPKRGKVSVYSEKDHIRIFVDKDEEDYYLNKGYKRGDPSWMPGVNRGKIYVNNGTSNKMIYPEDLPEYESQGYSKGILRRPKGYRLLSSTTIM